MREFGAPIGRDTYKEIMELAQAIYDAGEPKRDVKASDFAMEDDPDQIVVHEVDLRAEDGQRLRVAVTEASARPPFEWLIEISSDIGEADYFKHYLIRDDDIVLAQRKVLTVVDQVEAQIIIDDLRTAQSWSQV